MQAVRSVKIKAAGTTTEISKKEYVTFTNTSGATRVKSHHQVACSLLHVLSPLKAYDCALPLFRVFEWIEAELAMQAGCSERSPVTSGQLTGPSSGIA